MQIVVSLGQLYGDVLYFGTSYIEGAVTCTAMDNGPHTSSFEKSKGCTGHYLRRQGTPQVDVILA